MFRNPFVIQYRKVAIEAQAFVVDIDLSERERSISEILGVTVAAFIRERQLVRAGLVRSAFDYFDRHLSLKEVSLANTIFWAGLGEYFAQELGDRDKGLIVPSRAYALYAVAEPPELALAFRRALGVQPLTLDVPGLNDLMSAYIAQVMAFLKPRIDTLR
jgi:hypothetical protein